jgi:superfamily II DNA helicase RecQ
MDIIASLNMSEANLYRATHPFNRPNLYYEASPFVLTSPKSTNTETGPLHIMSRLQDSNGGRMPIYYDPS